MKILHFYKSYYPTSIGGVEQVINQIAKGCNKYGVKSEVLHLSREYVPQTIEIDGHIVHRARLDFEVASTAFSISSITQFKDLAKRADVIHYHYPWPFMDLVHFLTRVKKPTLVTYHSDIIRQNRLHKLYSPLKAMFLKDVKKIVATSPNYLATSTTLSNYKNKISVIPIGLEKLAYPTPSSEKISYWEKKYGQKFFLFVGVLRYYKGLDTLIEAACKINYPILIVGSGPMEYQLRAQVNKLGLDNVHFLGILSDEDKIALFKLSFAIIFPSNLRSEAFGISLLEGAMFGKPLISCEIGTGTTFINVSDKTGLVVQPNDPNELHKAMQYLWENPKRANEMGRQAEKRYWEFFTLDRMARNYIKLYEELIKN